MNSLFPSTRLSAKRPSDWQKGSLGLHGMFDGSQVEVKRRHSTEMVDSGRVVLVLFSIESEFSWAKSCR